MISLRLSGALACGACSLMLALPMTGQAALALGSPAPDFNVQATLGGKVFGFSLDKALRKALQPLFPQVKDISLADYKVRILNSNSGTGAVTRVLIDWHDGQRRWSTVGAGTNILDATWLALADGYEFALTPVERVAHNTLRSTTQPATQAR